jgi:hypothetical protein
VSGNSSRCGAFSAEPEAAPRSRRGGEAAGPRRNAAPEVQRSDHRRVVAETPPKSRAEMEALGSLPNVVAAVVPHAKLAVHEEFPDEVATTIRSIFCSIRLVEERPLGVLMAEAVALRPTEAEAR